MWKYIAILAFLPSSAPAADVNYDYVAVVKKYRLAQKCGLKINAATQGWVDNFSKLLPNDEQNASVSAAVEEVEFMWREDPVKLCIQTRAQLFSEGWL